MTTDERSELGHPQRPEDARRLAAIMFSDVVGYTALTQSDESLALDVLEAHRKLLRPIFSKHGGREVKTIGDAFLVEFRSALDAVSCGVEMQQTLSSHNEAVTKLMRVQIRVGIHVGDVVERDGDVYGDTVNLASRIERLAESGGIAISSLVYEQVRNKVAYQISKMGEFQLKNVDSPAPVYSVSPKWASVRTEARTSEGRIAVLPLRNIGGTLEDEYLADGLTEELISSFAKLPSPKVIGRTSVMRFKGTTKSLSEIGRELDSQNILEGSLRRVGDRLRISVQLVDAPSEELVWARSYDKGVEDALDIQEEIADDVTTTLRAKFGENRGPTSAKSITSSGEAFLLYLKGQHRLYMHDRTSVEAAVGHFEQAVKLDPGFATAYAMLAQCQLFLGFYGFVPSRQAYEKAQPYLNRAIELDADLGIAHRVMGRLLIDRDHDWAGAEAEYRRALRVSPNSAEAHYWYALLLDILRRDAEAEVELKIAEELDPLSFAVLQVSGTVAYYTGRISQAIEKFNRALEIEPRAALAHTNLGLAYFEQGRLQEAIAEIKKAMELDPENFGFRADLCYVYSRAGMSEDARSVLREAESARKGWVPSVPLAGMYSSIGEKAKALALLQRAYEENSAYLSSLKSERWFDNLRSEPEFLALRQKLGLG